MSLRQRLAHIQNAMTSTRLSYPAGHFYSPICDPKTLKNFHQKDGELHGIDLNREGQLERVTKWHQSLDEFSWCHKDNNQFPIGDARALYCFLRELQPRRVVEVGCGYSSTVIQQTIKLHGMQTQHTLIDPDMTNLFALFQGQRINGNLMETPVQAIPLSTFEALRANDILFIDSTHVMKTGSDVHYELFEVLPRLQHGVFVHFHDIQFPFEYPREWVINRNYSWNEIYALRALLMYTTKFKIELWVDYLNEIGSSLGHGGSLWLQVL